jgi:hypothetical protein
MTRMAIRVNLANVATRFQGLALLQRNAFALRENLPGS